MVRSEIVERARSREGTGTDNSDAARLIGNSFVPQQLHPPLMQVLHENIIGHRIAIILIRNTKGNTRRKIDPPERFNLFEHPYKIRNSERLFSSTQIISD